LPLRLTLPQWRGLLRWFIRGLPSALIAEETRLERKRVLRALTAVRAAMARTVPREARRLPDASAKSVRRGAATLELYVADGRVWADVMPDADAERVGRLLRENERLLSIDSHGLQPAGVVYHGRLYRPARSDGGRPATPFGEIEAFWAYLQRQLRAKGGIRRARLRFYLAEYAWRYNHRKQSSTEQVRELLALVRRGHQVATLGLSLGGRSARAESSPVGFRPDARVERCVVLTETVPELPHS
jgi:hypothetical protein